MIGALPAFVPLHHADIYRNYLYSKLRGWIDAIPGHAARPLICHCLCCSGKNLFSDQKFLPKILPAVTATVQEVALQEGFSEFVFLFVREHEEALRSALTESGFRSVFLSSAAILENRFRSFDDYLHTLSRNGKGT